MVVTQSLEMVELLLLRVGTELVLEEIAVQEQVVLESVSALKEFRSEDQAGSVMVALLSLVAEMDLGMAEILSYKMLG